jgi:hypothetical protein
MRWPAADLAVAAGLQVQDSGFPEPCDHPQLAICDARDGVQGHSPRRELAILLFICTDIDIASLLSRNAQEIHCTYQRASPIVASFTSRGAAS